MILVDVLHSIYTDTHKRKKYKSLLLVHSVGGARWEETAPGMVWWGLW